MLTVFEDSLVLVPVFESFVDAFCDGLAVKDETFCDRWLWIKKNDLNQTIQHYKFHITSSCCFLCLHLHLSRTHHAGVIVCLLSGIHQVKLCQVCRETLRTVYQHLLQTCQVLQDATKKKYNVLARNSTIFILNYYLIFLIRERRYCKKSKLTWRLSGSS